MAPLTDGDVRHAQQVFSMFQNGIAAPHFLPLAERFGVCVDEIEREFARVMNALPPPRYDTILARRGMHCCKSDLPCSFRA